MATQNQSPRRTKPDTIQCPNCKEEYSTTYRRCPFCHDPGRRTGGSRAAAGAERAGSKDRQKKSPNEEVRQDRHTTEGSGRRVARTGRGGGYGKPDYLNQILFFAITLSLIIAACVVVGKVVGPLLGREPDDDMDPSISETVDPDDIVTPQPDTTPEVAPPAPVFTTTDITLNYEDVTLSAGERLTIEATLTPADSTDTVVWTVDDEAAATITLAGVITNTNTSGSTVAVNVTATVGDVSQSCIIRCKSGATGGTTTPSTSTATGNATVTGASSGLNVRSGPSTSDGVIASLENGSDITVLSTPTSGWYEISFTGQGGTTQKGYASADFITVN